MPKYTVTQNMGAALRNLRVKRNFKSIVLANSINKTGAYITKLEKGELNTIASEDLITLIATMSKNEDEIEEAIKDLLSDTTMEYSEEEKANEEWKINLDQFYRKITIPEEYINILKNELNDNVTTLELSNYICLNSDLYNNSSFTKEMLDNAPKNRWIFNGGIEYVVMDISENTIDNILNRTELKTNYSTLFCILMSSYRLNKLSKEEAYSKAHKTLHSLKIYTLKELEDRLQSFDNQKYLDDFLEQRYNKDLPDESISLINNLYYFTKYVYSFSEIYDINYANNKLKTFNFNFEKDPILIMGYMGVNLSKLFNVDIKIKKEFIDAIDKLVDEYSTMTLKEEKPELI